jgi:hypothetical protein
VGLRRPDRIDRIIRSYAIDDTSLTRTAGHLRRDSMPRVISQDCTIVLQIYSNAGPAGPPVYHKAVPRRAPGVRSRRIHVSTSQNLVLGRRPLRVGQFKPHLGDLEFRESTVFTPRRKKNDCKDKSSGAHAAHCARPSSELCNRSDVQQQHDINHWNIFLLSSSSARFSNGTTSATVVPESMYSDARKTPSVIFCI